MLIQDNCSVYVTAGIHLCKQLDFNIYTYIALYIPVVSTNGSEWAANAKNMTHFAYMGIVKSHQKYNY